MNELVTEILAELVSTPSVNPLFAGPRSGPGGEAEIIGKLEERLRALGLETWVVEAEEEGRPSLVGCWRGSGGGRSLMLNGHIDTVGVEDYDDPFSARIEGGRLYGRGSYDMKGGVAACLAAIARLVSEGRRLPGDVWFSAVADEETASLGARAVAPRFPCDGVVVTEPTELRPVVAHKGFVWLQVETKGFACHGSLHERGVDANRRIAPVFRALDRLEEERSALSHALLGVPSLHVGRIEGGLGPSLYSPSCSATVELRTLPGEDTGHLQARLAKLLSDEWPHQGEATPRIELALERPYLETDPSGLLPTALATAMTAAGCQAQSPSGIAFWTDAGIFQRHAKDVVLFGPAGAGAHESVEWVDLDSVQTSADVLYRLALDYCG